MPEKLYNGIELPDEWPPRNIDLNNWQPMRVPYLEKPLDAVNISVGRQLFVDDFLIEYSSMTRVFHYPVKYPGNPVLYPVNILECDPDYPPCAISKSGGVWFDDRDNIFRMWYMAGYLGFAAYAESIDGIHWQKPELDIVPGTNLVLPMNIHPDSGTVWIDKETTDENARYKMIMREPDNAEKGGYYGALIMTSSDGIHWSEPQISGPMGDRSTMFYNPFRQKWVQSIRSGCQRGRCRKYWEHEDFIKSTQWKDGEQIPWANTDCMDEAGDSLPQLYNLDAVPYESLMIGFYQIHKGPPNEIGESRGLPKLTELNIAYSRDGFHWHRPDRKPFIGANRIAGSWEYGYVEPNGGCCLVMGDELWFYYTAYAGDPTSITQNWKTNGTYANGAVGLAKIRRDGFVSMEPKFAGALLHTRPLIFNGNRLFVNANTAGADLHVELYSADGKVIPDSESIAYKGNSTCAEITWKTKDFWIH